MNGVAMNKPRFVLDSSIIIKHLNNELDLNTFFSTQGEYEKCISVITFIEALADPDMTMEEEEAARDFISGCVFIDITPEIREKTVLIRRFKKNLRLPDAIIAATAIELNAILLSTDRHLKNFTWPGLITQPII
jgi:predicted nucleic acid-binding protein